MLDALTANEAKTHFGDLLLRAQRGPVQINKNGQPVAVVISMDEYANIEAMKLRLLQSRATQIKAEMAAGTLSDGDAFLDDLAAGQFD
ncbi:type II toxin-antitoxin system Phd/YefM family antitoxin [Paludibacterium purpuratum]|uniref:Antitoxin n=1 Tax=Paludibacterium purpuratum TaxID=1144873 RepID=A0A4R7B211_9NEIS|nr:type II toxin-antitoxin system Phd/YefM family antitoxin [Paludibacterium purpuratum]TDR73623.1 prevent-host-death family protein [Paludibacterium purpuratum]